MTCWGTDPDSFAYWSSLSSCVLDLSVPPPPFSSSSPPHTLVKFRCMVQDTTIGREMYIPSHKGAPRPALGQEIDYSLVEDRTVLWAVGVPGEQGWVEEVSIADLFCVLQL